MMSVQAVTSSEERSRIVQMMSTDEKLLIHPVANLSCKIVLTGDVKDCLLGKSFVSPRHLVQTRSLYSVSDLGHGYTIRFMC